MKKAKVLMLAGLMALSLLSGIRYTNEKVSAAETVKCELESAEGHRGDTVSVTIKVTSNPGTIMSQTKLAYDSDVVEVMKVTEHDMFRTSEIGNIPSDYLEPNMAKNPVQLINGFQAFSGNSSNVGNLYTFELKIKDSADFGESEISFSGDFLDYEFNTFPVVCEKAVIKVVCGHEDVKEEVEKAPTCTEEGINKKVCNICGQTVGTVTVSAKGHSLGEWENVKAATCTEAGTDKRVCSICGEEETRDVAALGHNAGEWTIIIEPTYTEEGMKGSKCTRCHEVLIEDIDKLSETEIVAADDIFKGYSINVSTKVFDRNNNELTDNKLLLKANEIKDVTTIKEAISKLITENEEIKSISAFEIKLVTNTEKTEVALLDRPVNVILKVPADYVANGSIYVLGDDGVWTESDVQMTDETISFDMTKTQTYAFANLGAVENDNNNTNNNDTPNEDKKPEDNNSDNTDNNSDNNSNNKAEENKDNIGNGNIINNTDDTKTDIKKDDTSVNTDNAPVKTGDSTVVWGFVGIMALSGLAVVITKKKASE